MCILALMSGSMCTRHSLQDFTHPHRICMITRFIVEEVREYQLVMDWGMMFGVVVPKVGASGVRVNIEVELAGEIPDPVELYVNLL